MKRTYAVVFERAAHNYSAYAPEIPGCGAAGRDWAEIQALIREGLAIWIDEAEQRGEPIPEPSMSVAEAMTHHGRVILEAGNPAEEFETTVALVEVETPPAAAAAPARRAAVKTAD